MTYLLENQEKIHNNLTKLSDAFGKMSSCPPEDFYQNAMLRILEKQNNYDPDKSTASFATYATGIAINEMRRTLLENQSIIVTSAKTRSLLNKLHGIEDIEAIHKIAEETKISKSRAELLSKKTINISYIDENVGCKEIDHIDHYIDRSQLNNEEKIVLDEFLKNKNFSEISRDNNIQYQYVLSLYESLIEKLKIQNNVYG